jgi:predicted PurR-regulated permease PerM
MSGEVSEEAPHARAGTAAVVDTGIVLLLVFGLLFGVYLILAPFAVGLMFGAIIAISSWPLRRGLCALGLSPGMAATVLVIAVLALVVVPLLLAAPSLDTRLKHLFDVVAAWMSSSPPPPDWLAGLPLVGTTLAQKWTGYFSHPGGPDITGLANLTRGAFLDVARGVGESLVQFLLAIVIAAMFWAKGDVLAATTRQAFRRIGGGRMDEIALLIAGAIRGVFYGVVGTAAIQGLAMAVGLLAAGVPSTVPIGFVTFLLALSQIGSVLIHAVWIGAVYWLQANDYPAIVLWLVGAWGIAVALSDNVLKPLLIGQSIRMPIALLMIGVFGGFLSFGFLGLFVGPVLIAVAWSLFGGWLASERGSDPAGAGDGHPGEGHPPDAVNAARSPP